MAASVSAIRKRIYCVFLVAAVLLLSATARAAEPTAQGHADVSPWRFRLTKGAGTPVCDAYLRRLNVTHFEHPPYCGRPENDSVTGFTGLHRVPLAPEEILALSAHVGGLMLDGDQYEPERRADRLRALGMNPPENSLANVRVSLRAGWLDAWRYEPPIDIENDGSRNNLVVWFGQGASSAIGVCGSASSNLPYPLRSSQVVLFLAPSGGSIDVEKTARVFGHPFPYAETKQGSGRVGLRMIGPEIGIFEYQHVYYFDSFFDALGDFNNQRAAKRQLIDTLGVFLRSEGKTREVCEYEMKNVQMPRAKP